MRADLAVQNPGGAAPGLVRGENQARSSSTEALGPSLDDLTDEEMAASDEDTNPVEVIV